MLLGHNRFCFDRLIQYSIDCALQLSTYVDIAFAVFNVAVIAISASDMIEFAVGLSQ